MYDGQTCGTDWRSGAKRDVILNSVFEVVTLEQTLERGEEFNCVDICREISESSGCSPYKGPKAAL